jgi:hypothetical protein
MLASLGLRSAVAITLVAAFAVTAADRRGALAADYSAPKDIFELRARDPQQETAPPERLFWPAWQESHRASLYGWFDCGIGGNTNGSDFNGPVGLQDRNGQAMMDQLYLVGERRLDVNTDDFEWGARVDLLYGTDAWQTTARGLDAYLFNQYDNFGQPRWDSSRYYALVMPQLYAEVGRGDVSVLFGHFYTPLGYEVVPAVGNFFYSHSYTFMFATPNTHTGVMAAWQPSEGVRIASGITNGWDNFSDGMPTFVNASYPGASSNLAYLGDFSFTSADGSHLLAIAVSAGNEYTPVVDSTGSPQGLFVGNRSMVTAYWQNELTERVTSVTEAWSAWQFNANTGFQNQGQPGGLAQWYGLCQYVYRGLTDTLSAGTRLEWYRDNNGYRTAYPARNAATGSPPFATGIVGNLWEVTLGLNWTPTPNWVIRPEIRYDWFTPDAYGSGALPFGSVTTRPGGLVTGDAFDQWYLGCDAILQF